MVKGKASKYMNYMEKKWAVLLFLCLSLVCRAEARDEGTLKVGFIMVGPVKDLGWNYTHDQGRKYLESTLKNKVQTTMVENVPENAEVERVVEKMIAQGNKLIFATSYGYLEPVLRVAARHPEVIVMHCQRSAPPSAKNVGTYFANQFAPMYVAGIVAGHMTKTGKLGYVGGHPIPQILACVNAFTLGARKVNPKVRTKVVWTGSWDDAATEAEATKGLIEGGADVINSQLDSGLTVVKTAEKNGVYSVGSESDLSQYAPKGWLTGQIWNWGPLYVKIAQSVIDHTWKPGNQIYELKDGYSDLAPYGTAVPAGVRKEGNTIEKEIRDGKLVVFRGPLIDRDGKMRIKSGEVLDSKGVDSVDWVVEGVDGALSKK
jgi:basic membrane protein A